MDQRAGIANEVQRAANAGISRAGAGAGAAFGTVWLETYGLDVDAEVTDVVGAFALT